MEKLSFTYFYENGSIYPFFKSDQEESHQRFYQLRNLEKNGDEAIAFQIRVRQYLEVLKQGFSYDEVCDMIRNSLDFVSERRDFKAIEKLYLELDALRYANDVYSQKFELKKCKVLN